MLKADLHGTAMLTSSRNMNSAFIVYKPEVALSAEHQSFSVRNNVKIVATKMASRAPGLQDVFRLLNVKERKKMLARVLQFPEFNEEDDLQTAILIDVHYEMLSHLVNNGFPWREVTLFFEIFKSFLNKVQGKYYTSSSR